MRNVYLKKSKSGLLRLIARAAEIINHGDTCLGILMLILAIGVNVLINRHPWAKIQFRGLVGPATVPLLLTGIIFGLGILTLANTYYHYKKEKPLPRRPDIISREFFVIVLTGVSFPLLLKWVGFVFISPFFLAFLFWYWGERSWLRIGILSIFTTIIVYLGATHTLNIRFPVGGLWEVLGLF